MTTLKDLLPEQTVKEIYAQFAKQETELEKPLTVAKEVKKYRFSPVPRVLRFRKEKKGWQ